MFAWRVLSGVWGVSFVFSGAGEGESNQETCLRSTINFSRVRVVASCHICQTPGMESEMIVEQRCPIIFIVEVIVFAGTHCSR